MTGFPVGFPLTLDRGVRPAARGRVLVGGEPLRALRLSAAGAAELATLQATGATSPAAARLARTLVDGGFAHPRPDAAVSVGVTVVVPVHDRPAALDACLAAAGAPAIVVDDGSGDAAAVAAVCARHGARLVRLSRSAGPAAARNAAMAYVDSEFVAFLDSDCVPLPEWLPALLGHFADPLVAAVAPRVRGAVRPGAIGRFAAARSPLDLGAWPARVRPGGRVSYVPTAALIVRRSAFGAGFDPALRHGEDVDFVWRQHDEGQRVRYEPAVTVRHAEPAAWREAVARRFRYGTSAAPLADRHPGRLVPLVIHPRPAVVVGLLLARRPCAATMIAGLQAAVLARRLRPAGVPVSASIARSAHGVARTAVAASRAATMLAPAALTAGLVCSRTRPTAAALLVVSPLADWATRRPGLDPVRWSALCIADDIAYGAGVWAGAIRGRTTAPMRPVIARARMR